MRFHNSMGAFPKLPHGWVGVVCVQSWPLYIPRCAHHRAPPCGRLIYVSYIFGPPQQTVRCQRAREDSQTTKWTNERKKKSRAKISRMYVNFLEKIASHDHAKYANYYHYSRSISFQLNQTVFILIPAPTHSRSSSRRWPVRFSRCAFFSPPPRRTFLLVHPESHPGGRAAKKIKLPIILTASTHCCEDTLKRSHYAPNVAPSPPREFGPKSAPSKWHQGKNAVGEQEKKIEKKLSESTGRRLL